MYYNIISIPTAVGINEIRLDIHKRVSFALFLTLLIL